MGLYAERKHGKRFPSCWLRPVAVVICGGQPDSGWSSCGGKAFSTHHGRHTSRSKPLSDDQKALLDAFRTKVESSITSHGLTAADVQNFVDEIKKHPEVSTALLEEIRGEVGKLMQGQRFSFDFD